MYLPLNGKFNCLQATFASRKSKLLSHTVPHWLFKHTSSLPSYVVTSIPSRRMSLSVHTGVGSGVGVMVVHGVTVVLMVVLGVGVMVVHGVTVVLMVVLGVGLMVVHGVTVVLMVLGVGLMVVHGVTVVLMVLRVGLMVVEIVDEELFGKHPMLAMSLQQSLCV